METAPTPDKTFLIDELASLSGVARRTIRYYIELGLVDRPVGETRAASYGWRHLQQLLAVRQLTESGLSLDAVRRRLALSWSEAAETETCPAPGSIAVRSHLYVAPGVELVVDPGEAHLSPEHLRVLLRDALASLDRIHKEYKS